MRELFQSLPQGFLWYPVVAGLVFLAVRTILLARGAARRRSDQKGRPATRFEELDDRINHRSAHASLERTCIGMVLTAAGYSGYSIDNCRRYLASGAPQEVERAIQDHLDGAPDRTGEQGLLPSRIETVLTYIESQTED